MFQSEKLGAKIRRRPVGVWKALHKDEPNTESEYTLMTLKDIVPQFRQCGIGKDIIEVKLVNYTTGNLNIALYPIFIRVNLGVIEFRALTQLYVWV